MDLYILAGQSNMSGRGCTQAGDVSETSITRKRQLQALDANCEWNVANGGFYSYENYPDHMLFMNPEKVGLGPGLRFAERVAEEMEGPYDIGLIPTAVGGSEIKEWHPETGKLYKEAIKRTREAQKRGVVRALLWHQGESDATESKCSLYAERLREVIAGFRRDLNAPDLLVLVGTLGSYLDLHFAKNMFGHWTVVNEQIREVANEDDRVYLVEAEDLASGGDNLHFSRVSAQRLGERYFDGYALALKEDAVEKVSEPLVSSHNEHREDEETETADYSQKHTTCCRKFDGLYGRLPWGSLYYVAGVVIVSGSLTFAGLDVGSFFIVEN